MIKKINTIITSCLIVSSLISGTSTVSAESEVAIDNISDAVVLEDRGEATPEKSIVKGVYTVGSDINPGSYTITLNNLDNATIIATFENDDTLNEYTSYSSAENLGKCAKSCILANSDQPVHMSLDSGDLLYIEEGSGVLTASSEGSLCKGIYVGGKDIESGSYTINLSNMEQSSAIIATFSSNEDLVKYTSWDSSENLGLYGKLAAYADADKPFHMCIEDGDILFVGDGEGSITECSPGSLEKGIYKINSDIQPGSYTAMLENIDYSATIAIFDSEKKLIEYTSWDSYDNLEKNASYFMDANNEEQFHLSIPEAGYLFVSDGNGTIQED